MGADGCLTTANLNEWPASEADNGARAVEACRRQASQQDIVCIINDDALLDWGTKNDWHIA
jgi:hypothetical protein